MANTNQLAVKNETIDLVERRIQGFQQSGALHFPANYSPQNALKSAWLILQETLDTNKNPVLETCTRESIANALLDTVIQGLNPAKKQVYYIPYGTKLTAMRSYHGSMTVVMRQPGVTDFIAQVVYEGDEFEYSFVRGVKRVTKHAQKLQNIDTKKIVAAYATVIYDYGKTEYTEIMTMAQIRQSWAKTKMAKNSVQTDFPEEMAKRTVINRTAKLFINTSCDDDLVLDAFNASTDTEAQEEAFKREVKENANAKVLDVPYTEYEPVPEQQAGRVVDEDGEVHGHAVAQEPEQTMAAGRPPF